MTKEEFTAGFEKLKMAFSTANAEEKIKIYYEELRKINAAVFAETCRRLVRETDRFPTISLILRTAESVRPPQGAQTQKQKCPGCDGFGWAIFDGYAFRGRCEHGGALSRSISFVPVSEVEKFNWARGKEKKEKELAN